MEQEFLTHAFAFHQTIFQDLRGRKWDRCSLDMILEKIDFVFKLCYGETYIENADIDKVTTKMRRKFMEVSHRDPQERRMFNVCFIYAQLRDKETHCISPVFWTVSNEDRREILIDISCRQYPSFDEFLTENVFPKCFMTFPENGIYSGTNFVKLNCAWSPACKLMHTVKKCADVVALGGSIGATGALFFTPAGIPLLIAQASFISTSIYSLCRGVENLVDVEKYRGGLGLNTETVAGIADVVLTTGTLITFGVSNILRTIATRSGKIIVEGSTIYKVIVALENSFKVISTSGVAIYFLLMIKKFHEGTLTPNDFLTFTKYVAFSLNCFITVDRLKKFIEDFSNLGYEKIHDCFMNMKKDAFVLIKEATKFMTSSNFDEILRVFFPTEEMTFCREIGFVKGKVTDFMSVIEDCTAGRIDPATFFHRLVICGDNLLTQMMSSMRKKEEEVTQLVGSDRWKQVLGWESPALGGGERNRGHCGTYDDRLKMLEAVERGVIESTKLVTSCEDKEHRLFEHLLALVSRDDIEDDFEALLKLNFYCSVFSSEMQSLTEQYVYNQFLETAEAIRAKQKKSRGTSDYICASEKCRAFEQRSFENIMKKMHDDFETYHQQFLEMKASLAAVDSDNTGNRVYVFAWPSDEENTDVAEVYLKIANSVAGLGLTRSGMELVDYNNVVLLKIKRDSSIVVFCKKEFENDLKGIMIHVPTF